MTDRTQFIVQLGRHVLRRVEADPETGCLLWMGGCSGEGYGAVRIGGRMVAPHRLVLAARGVDVAGKVVHHTCGRPHCVQRQHLVAMTNGEHVALHHKLRREAAA